MSQFLFWDFVGQS